MVEISAVLGLYFEIGPNGTTVRAGIWTFLKFFFFFVKLVLVQDFALFYEDFKWEMWFFGENDI